MLCGTAHIIAVDTSSTHVLTNGIQQPVRSAPSVFPEKSARGNTSQLHSKQRSKGPSPEYFLTIDGCFESHTYHVTTLGCMVEEERKKEEDNNSDLQPFQVCYFKIVTTHCYYYTADWDRLYKLFDVLLDASICSLAMISLCKC